LICHKRLALQGVLLYNKYIDKKHKLQNDWGYYQMENHEYVAAKVYEHAMKPHLRKSATLSFFYSLWKVIRITLALAKMFK
jgi:hypothetical protein